MSQSMSEDKGNEFDFIESYFRPLAAAGALYLQDDAALVEVPTGMQQLVSTDIMVAGIHIPAMADGCLWARRLVASAVSDLAAMGATPQGCVFNLGKREDWDKVFMRAFADEFANMLAHYELALWGGDSVCSREGFMGLTVHGLVKNGQALRRAGAQVGDIVYVSGVIGAAADFTAPAYTHPVAQIALGQALRGKASACIDISDGLAADLDHICTASACGMDIDYHAIPLVTDNIDLLAAGDDYQLAFTMPAEYRIADLPIPVTAIGSVTKGGSARFLDANHNPIDIKRRGFIHF